VVWLRHGHVVAQGNPEVLLGEYVAELANETRRRTPPLNHAITTSSGTELAVNKNRFGSMEMEITSVDLLDGDHRPIVELESGDGLCVVIGYRATKPISRPIFSATISREDGFLCFDTNTAAQGLEMPRIEGCGEITLNLERVDLAAGNYFVDVGIYECQWTYGYDYHWHAYPLRIHATGSDKGLLHLPQHWELRTVRPAATGGTISSSRTQHAVLEPTNSR
jgi:lipopolysaccharide transport system ATP-binding protein